MTERKRLSVNRLRNHRDEQNRIRCSKFVKQNDTFVLEVNY